MVSSAAFAVAPLPSNLPAYAWIQTISRPVTEMRLARSVERSTFMRTPGCRISQYVPPFAGRTRRSAPSICGFLCVGEARDIGSVENHGRLEFLTHPIFVCLSFEKFNLVGDEEEECACAEGDEDHH